MTPHELAALHARVSATPWSAESFTTQLGQPGTIASFCEHAFAIGRVILDEAELLQIATTPEHQKQGFARQMLATFERAAKARGCTRAFLEVAQSNCAAQTLYTSSGWKIDGRRKAYYPKGDGTREDALVMSKNL